MTRRTARDFEWPDSSRTVSRLAPLLLAGLAPTGCQNGILRDCSSLAEKESSDPLKASPPELTKAVVDQVVKMKKEQQGVPSLPLTAPSAIKIHASHFCNDLIQKKAKAKGSSSAPVAITVSQNGPCESKSLPKGRSKIPVAIPDFISRFDQKGVSRSSVLPSLSRRYSQKNKPDPTWIDDRAFERSYYNRKSEFNIYSKPPNLRRARNDISVNDPEYGLKQDWMGGWEPTEEFVRLHLKTVQIAGPAGKKRKGKHATKKGVPPPTTIASKVTDATAPNVADTICPYELPQRQEYKRLDEAVVARLVEIQTGHIAYKHRKMRPTLGASRLNRGISNHRKTIHIGPQTSHNHVDLNDEDEDNTLELDLAIHQLSMEDREIEQTLSTLNQKEKLAHIQAANERKKMASQRFRNYQQNVERIVTAHEAEGILAARLAQQDKFLHASEQHPIFLEVSLRDLNVRFN